MSVITDLTKNVDVRPFYAVVGVTDLTVEKAREAAVVAEARATKARADFDKIVADLAPAKVQERAIATFTQVQTQVQELPNTVAAERKANADKLGMTAAGAVGGAVAVHAAVSALKRAQKKNEEV